MENTLWVLRVYSLPAMDHQNMAQQLKFWNIFCHWLALHKNMHELLESKQ